MNMFAVICHGPTTFDIDGNLHDNGFIQMCSLDSLGPRRYREFDLLSVLLQKKSKRTPTQRVPGLIP